MRRANPGGGWGGEGGYCDLGPGRGPDLSAPTPRPPHRPWQQPLEPVVFAAPTPGPGDGGAGAGQLQQGVLLRVIPGLHLRGVSAGGVQGGGAWLQVAGTCGFTLFKGFIQDFRWPLHG